MHFIESETKITRLWDLSLVVWAAAEEGALILIAESDLFQT